jgi:hypothetical protein
MSVEPVTVSITIESDQFGSDTDAIARTKAAEELGLDEGQIICIQRGAAKFEPEVLYGEGEEIPEGGSAIKVPARMTIESTWAPEQHATVPKGKPIEWPSLKLGRGSRWNGTIPSPSDPTIGIEATLISDGEKLIPMESPEGRAILLDLR